MPDIRLPRCWRDLLNIEEFDSSVTSHHRQQGIADPNPHYDDVRQTEYLLTNGNSLLVELTSGQSNYWLAAAVLDPERVVIHDFGIIEDLGDGDIWEGAGYKFTVKLQQGQSHE